MTPELEGRMAELRARFERGELTLEEYQAALGDLAGPSELHPAASSNGNQLPFVPGDPVAPSEAPGPPNAATFEPAGPPPLAKPPAMPWLDAAEETPEPEQPAAGVEGVPVLATLAWRGAAPEPEQARYVRPTGGPSYPMAFEVAYPERLSRWKTALRGLLILPAWTFAFFVGYVVYFALGLGWVTVFLRRKYPGWLFAASAGSLAFLARTWAYGALMTDGYPAFDATRRPVRLEFARPPNGHLSRWRVYFWKGVLLIPHFVVLSFLLMAAGVVVFLAWFAIIITGRYPRGLFAFVEGVTRWCFRVAGYFASFNDRYPPFSLAADAGPAASSTVTISGIIGGLAAGGTMLLFVIGAVLGNSPVVQEARYADLQANRANLPALTDGDSFDPDVSIRLRRVYDPGDDQVKVLELPAGTRAVIFEWTIANTSGATHDVQKSDLRLVVQENGKKTTSAAVLVTVQGQVEGGDILSGSSTRVRALFVITKAARPVALNFDPPWNRLNPIRYDLVY